VVGSLPCPLRNPQCKLIGGLEFHVWRRVDNGCREVAIAFRGTDRNDLGDWQSNFRWLHRLAPRFDQYDQVRENIGTIVQRIEAAGCNSPNVRFVAVGHSLGGGLAEQVGYAHPKIRYVYAFDPSPVTGFFDVSALCVPRTMQTMGSIVRTKVGKSSRCRATSSRISILLRPAIRASALSASIC